MARDMFCATVLSSTRLTGILQQRFGLMSVQTVVSSFRTQAIRHASSQPMLELALSCVAMLASPEDEVACYAYFRV